MKLLDEVRNALRLRHYAHETEKSWTQYLR